MVPVPSTGGRSRAYGNSRIRISSGRPLVSAICGEGTMTGPDRRQNLPTGRQGESLAAAYLEKNGYTIICRNYRRRFGEIDIIARHRGFTVFIEVKTRRSGRFGGPLVAVDRRKQQQIYRVAEEYLASHGLQETPARFDVVSVALARDGRVTIDVIENAFEGGTG
ncbi:YraN family protein [Desulfolithobacter dissulfuricans]|nr:YraN family protein [Desulfolithobacter dissulfuricans]